MLSLTLALAVAGGGTVCGWTSPKPRPVLYVDGEMHIQDLRDRLAMLRGTVDGLDAEAAGRNLTVISRQFQKATVRFPDLAKPDDQDVILRAAARVKAELVICDNFSTLAEVSDENEAAAMTPVLTFLMRLKQAGHAAILVHHSDKTGANYRGSSKLATTFEVIIGLHRLEGRAVGDGAGFELRWGKFRGRPSAATRDMEMRLEEDSEGTRWTHGPSANAEMATVLDAVRSGRFRNQREIARAFFGGDDWRVTRLRTRAIERGEITMAAWKSGLAGAGEGDAEEF